MNIALLILDILFAFALAYGASLAVRAVLAGRRRRAITAEMAQPGFDYYFAGFFDEKGGLDAEAIAGEIGDAASELATAATGIRPDGEYVEHSEHGDGADPNKVRRREHQVVKNAAIGLARAVLDAVAVANAREPRAIPPDQQAAAHPGAGLSRRAGLL